MAAEACDLFGAPVGNAGIADQFLFFVADAPPPLNMFESLAIAIGQRNLEATGVVASLELREREVILEWPRQFEYAHAFLS